MFEWLSYHRADFAAFIIILLVAAFCSSVWYGVKWSRERATDQVFGDPERTRGGWFWAVSGVSVLLLLWFYFSWGAARAYFPKAANELCQIAKIEEALSPVLARLPIGSRYYKSTDLVNRNNRQLDVIEAEFPQGVFLADEEQTLISIIDGSRQLISLSSDSNALDTETVASLEGFVDRINMLTSEISKGSDGLVPPSEAANQPPWGVTTTEISLLPETSKGVMYDRVAVTSTELAKDFVTLRNIPKGQDAIISRIKADLAELKASDADADPEDADANRRKAYVKGVERIFKRLDDGMIFPANSMAGVNNAIVDLKETVNDSKGSLSLVEAVFFPGGGVVKSRTLCIEQGSSRWLPKPLDVVATFGKLANPDLEGGGGYKGVRLLWWKWLPISDVVAFVIPDGLVDVLPGQYGAHDDAGQFSRTYKDWLLDLATGDLYLGSVPMLDGHIWDSMFRVLVALGLGILAGVPLGIYMGVSRFFKSFFDPMIELYRPVPPLAWAPLILTIFGIQDDGKIFLLFMVSFAIMVISARTGASGTQLSKIRASHSLGASNQQIMRHVILPNALPEILTGIRIAIGVCWMFDICTLC